MFAFKSGRGTRAFLPARLRAQQGGHHQRKSFYPRHLRDQLCLSQLHHQALHFNRFLPVNFNPFIPGLSTSEVRRQRGESGSIVSVIFFGHFGTFGSLSSEDVHAILFVVSLSCYNQVLEEDQKSVRVFLKLFLIFLFWHLI
jgi:hypothetical protein